ALLAVAVRGLAPAGGAQVPGDSHGSYVSNIVSISAADSRGERAQAFFRSYSRTCRVTASRSSMVSPYPAPSWYMVIELSGRVSRMRVPLIRAHGSASN